MKKKKKSNPVKKVKAKKKRSSCHLDDFACRVYSFCATKKCALRGARLRSKPAGDCRNALWGDY